MQGDVAQVKNMPQYHLQNYRDPNLKLEPTQVAKRATNMKKIKFIHNLCQII